MSLDEAAVRDRLRAFLAQFHPGRELADDEDVFRAGFVTSLVALELVGYVEDALGVPVADEDLELDNFRSVDALTALVVRRSAAR